jgi:hypothetical protein
MTVATQFIASLKFNQLPIHSSPNGGHNFGIDAILIPHPFIIHNNSKI